MTRVAIIGAGTMGQYTGQELGRKAAEAVRFYDDFSKPELTREGLDESLRTKFGALGKPYKICDSAADAVKKADVVVFCVPTDQVYDVMRDVLPHCKKGALISGQTSRKAREYQAYKDHKDANPGCRLGYVGIHTRCNPENTDDPREDILNLIRQGATERVFETASDLFSSMSYHIEVFDTVEEHDAATVRTQLNTSWKRLSIASSFAQLRCFPWLDPTYGSSFDVMKCSSALRAADLIKPHVYRGIWHGNGDGYGERLVWQITKTDLDMMNLLAKGDFSGYRERVLAAKKRVYRDIEQAPILDDDAMASLSVAETDNLNTHISSVLWFVGLVEAGVNPFQDLRATTPAHRTLLCEADRLFNTDELERALSAPVGNRGIIYDDLAFFSELMGWGASILKQRPLMYDSKHASMMAILREDDIQPKVKEYVDLSERVVTTCRESLDKAVESGRIQAILKDNPFFG